MSPARVASPLVPTAHHAPLRWARALGIGLAAAIAVIVLAAFTRPPQIGQTATASVSWPLPRLDGQTDSAARWAYGQRLRQAVLSDSFLLAALRRASGQAGGELPSPAGLRPSLDVNIQIPGEEDRVNISITCRAENPRQACRLASALAEETIAWAAAEESQAALASRHVAQAAVEQARNRYRQAKARLESFLDQYFSELQKSGTQQAQVNASPHEIGARAAAGVGATGPATQTSIVAPELNTSGGFEVGLESGRQTHAAVNSAGPPAARSENPRWVRLTRELEGLRSDLAIMLIERTPAHPAVQDLQRRIRELEIHLKSMPRFVAAAQVFEGNRSGQQTGDTMAGVPANKANAAPGTSRSPPDPAPSGEAGAHRQAAQTYRKYKDEWLAAACELDQAEATERQQWGRGSAQGARGSDRLVLRLPEGVQAEALATNWSHVAALALAAGLTAAFGTLLVCAGLDIDIPLASATHVRKRLKAPILGVVRLPTDTPPGATESVWGRKVGLMAAGCLVLAGCAALVAAGL